MMDRCFHKNGFITYLVKTDTKTTYEICTYTCTYYRDTGNGGGAIAPPIFATSSTIAWASPHPPTLA